MEEKGHADISGGKVMAMKPILFNTDMVRAILEGRKTVTRRTCKIKINDHESVSHNRCMRAEYPARNMNGVCVNFLDSNGFYVGAAKPPYNPGDILYVRETFTYVPGGSCVYKASVECPDAWKGTWHPSIHMPKEAARLFLRVTDVRAERLQDMCLIDCLKEGVQFTIVEQGDLVVQGIRARDRFSGVWDRTIKPAELPIYGWKENPWVWVISFERISREEAMK